ncbi:hypothetical protein FJO69_01415 [[Mycoplasma] falconis]|uniref:Lipoprotein n=1 Tax=[Mycoplasma] falconis TaxID=92403 RepID=A0A501XB43_9BACT|nr:aromatic motif membrane protein [[Mycoplasma] falconis]TPE57573.1 hypothetical protein FJO69_01415 [[Mycoplasma] falconis]
MKNKFIKFSLIASSITPAIASCLISCTNYGERDKLKDLIPTDRNVIQQVGDKEQKHTNAIIDQLLNFVFKNNKARLTTYLNQQNDSEYQKEIKAKFIAIAKEFNNENIKNNFEAKENIVNKYYNFYNQNWLFILRNLKNFEGEFVKWVVFPNGSEGGKHSKEYLQHLKEIDTPNNIDFKNNYLKQLKEGDESAELANKKVLYLKKDKALFRLDIDRTLTENPIMNFQNLFWYFPNAKNDNISIPLVSDIVHFAYLHGFQIGFEHFEKDMVVKNKYGEPAYYTLIYKEANNEA